MGLPFYCIAQCGVGKQQHTGSITRLHQTRKSTPVVLSLSLTWLLSVPLLPPPSLSILTHLYTEYSSWQSISITTSLCYAEGQPHGRFTYARLCIQKGHTFGLVLCCCHHKILNNLSWSLCFVSEIWWGKGPCTWADAVWAIRTSAVLVSSFPYSVCKTPQAENSRGPVIAGGSARLKKPV